jgi:hypothetical protein
MRISGTRPRALHDSKHAAILAIGKPQVTQPHRAASQVSVVVLAALSAAEGIFGEPLYPNPAEHQDVQVLRNQLASPGDPPTKHLGEAETVAIITRRRIFCFFVTDDRDAARLATQNGITVTTTWRLLQLADRKKRIDADTLWGYVQTLRVSDRGTPPGVRDRAAFDKWLPA